MTKLAWGAFAKRIFEMGVDRGVFYPTTGAGVAWDGLVSVTESVDDTTQTVTYFDGEMVQSRLSLGSFQAALAAITYPDEFEGYNGSSDHLFYEQPRKAFNFSYRTLIGNALEGLDRGYKLHLVYNALASPSDVVHATKNDSVELSAFSWDISTTPVPFTGFRPSSHVVIDSTKVYPWALAAIEEILYGVEFVAPRFPTSEELLSVFENASILKITDHGDGTWTAEGPDDVVYMLDATTFEISWPSAVYIDSVSYTVKSL